MSRPRVHILFSGKQSGHDAVVSEWARRVEGSASDTDDEGFAATMPEADVLLLYGAIEPYLANRFKIPGRPWVCAASFWFQDLYSLYRNQIGLQDTGLKAIFTNCHYYVETADGTVPTQFCWPPVPSLRHGAPVSRTKTGTVLPNVEDRDFSLLEFVRRTLEANGERLTIFMHEAIKERLPASLVPCIEWYDGVLKPEMDCYAQLRRFIPAPRLTDYRYKVIPREIFRAVAAGAQPYLIRHPILPDLDGYVAHTFASCRSYVNALLYPATQINTSRLAEHISSSSEVMDKILVAYERWKANATA